MLQNISTSRRFRSPAEGERRRAASESGFTLPEILIVMAITTMVMAGIFSFYLQFYTIGFVNEQRNRINRDMRQLTGELSDAGRQSNYFMIYKSAAAGDRDEAGDRRVAGMSGDLLVFVFTERGASALQSNRITRISCYFRSEEGEEALGPVRRYTEDFSPSVEVNFSEGSSEFESMLPSMTDLASAEEVVELSKGLADGRLFYNFWGRSIMVNGQIYHGNDAKRVTETYNFTISPRG